MPIHVRGARRDADRSLHLFPALMLIAACSGDGAQETPAVQAGTGFPAAGSGATAGTGTIPTAGTGLATSGTGATGSGAAGRPAAGGGGVPAPGGAAAASGGASIAGAMAAAGTGAASGSGGSGGAGAAGEPAAGSGGAAPPAPGGFPKTDEVNIKAKGPYMVMTYTDGLDERTYASSMMYYPVGAQEPFGVVAFTPGFTATKENYTFLGDMLASHGIVALLTTPTSTSDQPPARGDDLVAAVMKIKAENTRMGSPLMGKLATDRICVTGHSMGGGGTLFAANELGDMIKCAMPLQPWQPGGSFPMIKAPIMFIGAASDTIAAVSGNAAPHYASIPDSTEKFLVVFEGDHYLSTNRTSTDQTAPEEATPSYDIQAAYIIPFYKLFLESDERYRPYLYGAMRSMMSVTRYDTSKM
jgi:dienelactone hydrolase